MVKRNLKSQSAYLDWLADDLADCESILELGCGSYSPILKIGYGQKTAAVDIWQPYIDQHNKAHDYRHCWKADILTMPFPNKTYDAVVMFDVMEHLPIDKQQMKNLLAKFESCARKKVILFTPNGFVENDHVDGDPWQEHVSAWEPGDYPQGYKIRGADGFRWLFGKAGVVKRRPRIFFEYCGQFTQPFVYYKPEWAWHSYAVKEIE
jgi:SAM-dependent methyltransferase